LTEFPNTAPRIASQKAHLSPDDRLPDEAIAFITAADTVFLGTTYKAFTQDALKFPSHLGMNQRGGRPGFIRVLPSDGRTVVIPDFSGTYNDSASRSQTDFIAFRKSVHDLAGEHRSDAHGFPDIR
jgi:hypothetical protein